MKVSYQHLLNMCPDRIREIEMSVDGCLRDQTYAMQFWTDVRLYGLASAYTYLRNHVQGDPINRQMYVERLVETEALINTVIEFCETRRRIVKFTLTGDREWLDYRQNQR